MRLGIYSIIAASSTAGLIALTTEWDPIEQLEELPIWQKVPLVPIVGFIAFKSTVPALHEAYQLALTN